MPNTPLNYIDDNGLLYYDGIVKNRLSSKADSADIPTTVAELTDASDYALVSSVPTTVAELTDASDYALASSVPTTVAELSDSSDYALKTDLVGGMKYKGSVQSYSSLPQSGMVSGDMWNVATADSTHGIAAGDNVVWNGSSWDVMRGTIDTSAFLTASDFHALTNAEIDALLTEV